MKSLIIYGSPRHKKSASYHLGENFANGMRKAGAHVDEIMLCKQKINHCIGCFTCWTKTPGVCIHKDDMVENLSKLQQADLIVYAIPLYIFSVPGLVKDFMDRSLPLYQPYLIEEKGASSHPKRVPKEQKIFLISVAGFPELSHFDSLIHWFKKMYNKNEYLGEIVIGGSELMSMDAMQDRYKKLYIMIEKAGYEIVKNSNISEETKSMIKNETFIPEKQLKFFRDMANQYWDSFLPKDYSQVQVKMTENVPLKISDGGMATFFAGMAMQYNPDAIPGLISILQFILDDESYYLLINKNSCVSYKGTYPDPSLTIKSPKDIWMKISTGELNGASAFMEGLYKVEGNFNLLMKMDTLFRSIDTGTQIKKKSERIAKEPEIKTFKKLKLLSLNDGGNAAFFAGMAAQYNPNIDPNLNVIIQFKFENENYHLIIKDGSCKAYEGIHTNPSVKILTPADVWMKISSGELSGAKAYLKKLYTVEGDMGILLKMEQYFSKSKPKDTNSKRYEISPQILEKVSENRGPLKIPGLLWLNIAFIPWILLWIWYSISPGLIPLISVAAISTIIMLYHLITNRPTLFESGSCLYLITAAFLFGMGVEFFITYLTVINNIFLGGLWLISLVKVFCLTAEYSRHGLPKAIWSTRAFIETNNILTSLWGIFFLCSAIINLISIAFTHLSLILMILGYLLLIPMFAFTSWFQKWYPARV